MGIFIYLIGYFISAAKIDSMDSNILVSIYFGIGSLMIMWSSTSLLYVFLGAFAFLIGSVYLSKSQLQKSLISFIIG
jgi:hypothetical protein